MNFIYGALIGLTLGLTGAGGSIITIPILLYLLNMDIHSATGTSLIIVGIVPFFIIILAFYMFFRTLGLVH